MADIFDMVPEMASLMEDTSVEVDVEVGAPEAVEAEAEAVEATEEVTEGAAEAEETEEAVEMVFRRMDELERMHAHIQKYGVSREFMAWHNYDGRLAASLGITVPETESLDAIGNPNSALAIACCESIGEAIKSGAKKVWEFIKKICAKIASFISRIIEWVKMKFGRLNPTIGRLKTAYGERVFDSEKKDVKASFLTAAQINEHAPVKTISDNISGLTKLTAEAAKMADKIDESASAHILQHAQKFGQEIGGGIATFVENLDKEKPKPSEQAVDNTAWGSVPTLLDIATQCARAISGAEVLGRTIKQFSDSLSKAAKQAEQRKDDYAAEVKAAARALSSELTKANTCASKLLKGLMWTGNQSLKSASIIINRGGKKK